MKEATKSFSKYIVGHSSCTRNGNHLSLLFKADNTRNERMMSQTITHFFERVRGEE